MANKPQNGAAQRLVVVESPTKATKIASYLGAGYEVLSSRGHIRDLPTGAAEVPAKYKGQPWARTGVNVDDDFAPLYVVAADKRSTMRELKAALKDADELLLATDGDREGEAIAWHLLEELKPKVPARRMVFHEITKAAILEAVEHPRDLDTDLVDAQETRRILDRLYGYEVSPVLWKKVKPRLSAGRVQSVATRLIVDRERERIAFRSASYWDVTATMALAQDQQASAKDEPHFPARLRTVGGVRVAESRDFDDRGQVKAKEPVEQLDESSARRIATGLEQAAYVVTGVESRASKRQPYAPFRTTTLQQEGGNKLGFSSQRTMQVAQQLYEAGFITYMRTDSIELSSQAISAARSQAGQLYGQNYLPNSPRMYKSKVKNAQEAHEAIRPAGDTFKTPAQTGLTGDQFRLYELIWRRTLASQMADAQVESVTVQIEATTPEPIEVGERSVAEYGLTATGRTTTFDGFLRVYDDAGRGDKETKLPQLSKQQQLTATEVTPNGHETKPPARYTEPTLVARLEELEIGRPSTYASIIRTITSRDYVFKKGAALVPTWLAFAVTRMLVEHFGQLVDYDFTAGMEQTLDEIANGRAERVAVLSEFFFGNPDQGERGLQALVNELGEIDARAMSTFPVGDLDSGVVVRVGRYGTYVEETDAEGKEKRANVPDDLPPDELTLEQAKEFLARPMGEEREVGIDPETSNPIVVRTGRFGPYVTEVLPEDAPKSAKPRTASLFKSMQPETVTLTEALQLLSLPRVVGTTDDGTEVIARNGPYGPFVKKGTDSRSLGSEDEIFTVTMEQAEELFAQPKRRGRAAAKPPLKELGVDPVSEKPMVVKDGRFGPYVTDGVTNASLRTGDSLETLTDERASELLAERRAKAPAKKTPARRKAPAKKAPAKKAPAKTSAKAASKKAPAKSSATRKPAAGKSTPS